MTASSRYTYDDANDILINKLETMSQKVLEEYEAFETYRRLSELAYEDRILGAFDEAHLREIHKYIFQDIYFDKEEMKKTKLVGKLPLRGEHRIENIAKGSFQFASALFIQNALDDLFSKLKKENYLKGLEQDCFVKRATFYLAELNVVHPFREGNGRTTREFMRQLAYNAGYNLNWGKLSGKNDEFMQAMIASVHNTSKLEKILGQLVQKLK